MAEQPIMHLGGEGPSLPEEVPVLRLLNGVIYPGMLAPLTVTNPLDMELLDGALSANRLVGLVAQRDPDAERPGPEGLLTSACGRHSADATAPQRPPAAASAWPTRARITEWVQLEPAPACAHRARPEPTERDGTISARTGPRRSACADW